MLRVSSILLLGSLAWGQFAQIASTDDGRQIYFTTTLAQRSAPEGPVEYRIFRLDAQALQLFSEPPDLARRTAGSSNDGAFSLQVSGDGQSVAFVRSNICPSSDSCLTTITRAEIQGRYAQTFDSAERILLSRDGRWALAAPPRFRVVAPGQPPVENNEAKLINLETGAQVTTSRPATSDESFALASDGSVLVRSVGEDRRITLGLWRNGELRPLPQWSGAITPLGLSDDASIVIAQRLDVTPGPAPVPKPELVALDLRANTVRSIGSADGVGRWLLLGLSNDGRRALLGSLGPSGAAQGFLADTREGRLYPVSLAEGERPVAGAVTGYGDALIVGTTAGRIIRFAIGADGRPAPNGEELLPATPYIGEFARPVAPGLRMDIGEPLPGGIDWRGRIRLNGMPLAILGQDPGRLQVQIPWELGIGTANLTVDYSTASPLVQRDRPFVFPTAPGFPALPSGARGLLGGRLIKGDFSGYATELRPGDVVHLYLTGLGAVTGSVQTGMPAPADDIRPLTAPVVCRFLPGPATDAETLFAGLAPGMIGIYQLTLRAPANVFPNPNGLQCMIGSGSGFSFTTIPVP